MGHYERGQTIFGGWKADEGGATDSEGKAGTSVSTGKSKDEKQADGL